MGRGTREHGAARTRAAQLAVRCTALLVALCLPPPFAGGHAHAHGGGGTLAACKVTNDTDFQPGDVGMQGAATAQECCDLCAADSKCAKAAWNGPQFQTCYFKRASAQPIRLTGTAGCAFQATPAPPQPPGPGRAASGFCPTWSRGAPCVGLQRTVAASRCGPCCSGSARTGG